MSATSTVLSSCLFLAALGPCSATQPPPAPQTAPATAASRPAEVPRELPKQQTQTTPRFMRDHAQEALELRRGVIAGRFDQIHRVAAVIAGDDWSANLRPDYVPHVTAVRRAGSAALDARSMPAASAALGDLGAACAACHRAHGGPPEPRGAEPLTAGVGSMAMHAAAEQALWEGLFTPSEASWKRGAERLAEAPELGSDIDEVNSLGQKLRDLALQAKASAPNAALYGSITATCSSCHRRLDIDPQ